MQALEKEKALLTESEAQLRVIVNRSVTERSAEVGESLRCEN